MSGAPWTEAHRREALVRSSELLTLSLLRDFHHMIAGQAAAALGGGPLFARGEYDIASERGWREWIAAANPRFDPARIDREVRRVRGLAEGRLVRVMEWIVIGRGVVPRSSDLPGQRLYETSYAAHTYRKSFAPKARVLRVTRIRRAP